MKNESRTHPGEGRKYVCSSLDGRHLREHGRTKKRAAGRLPSAPELYRSPKKSCFIRFGFSSAARRGERHTRRSTRDMYAMMHSTNQNVDVGFLCSPVIKRKKTRVLFFSLSQKTGAQVVGIHPRSHHWCSSNATAWDLWESNLPPTDPLQTFYPRHNPALSSYRYTVHGTVPVPARQCSRRRGRRRPQGKRCRGGCPGQSRGSCSSHRLRRPPQHASPSSSSTPGSSPPATSTTNAWYSASTHAFR